MPINTLPTTTDALTSNDAIPYALNGGGTTYQATLARLLTFFESNFASPEFTVQTTAPSSTGFTATIDTQSTNIWLIVSPTATFAAGTIVLPPVADCFDGQQIIITTSQTITVLTVTLNGATAQGVPTSLLAGGFFALRFNTLQQKWFCVAQSLGATSTFDDITITSGTIKDLNGSTALQLTRNYVDPGPAVNNVTITNRAAGSSPAISATGSDTNIGLTLNSKGTGTLGLNALSGDLVALATIMTITSGTINVTTTGNIGVTATGLTILIDCGLASFATVVQAPTVKTTQTTVASLGSAATAGSGARRMVSDSTSAVFNFNPVVGGGANIVPVFSNGTNWCVG